MKQVSWIIFVVVMLVLVGCSDQWTDSPKEPPAVIKATTQAVIKATIQTVANKPAPSQVAVNSDYNTGLRADEVSKPVVISDSDTQYEIIEWTDLMPKEDFNALLSPPSYVTNAIEGSFEDQISSGIKSVMAAEVDDAYQRALVSKNVVLEYDGQAVKLAGFVVPLEFNDDQVITEFFLVPFFGACIHVPAPPPNQVIFVKDTKGFTLDALYSPIWVSGILSASLIENDIATSAYTLDMASFEHYKEPR
jgi:hypothetical protein